MVKPKDNESAVLSVFRSVPKKTSVLKGITYVAFLAIILRSVTCEKAYFVLFLVIFLSFLKILCGGRRGLLRLGRVCFDVFVIIQVME